MKHLSKRLVHITALSLAAVFILSISAGAASNTPSDSSISDMMDKVTTMTEAGRQAAAGASNATTGSAPAEVDMGSAPGVVTGGTINVRSGPGTDYSKVTMVSTGKSVKLLGKVNGWYHVSFDGMTGYIFCEYIYEGTKLPEEQTASAATPAPSAVSVSQTAAQGATVAASA